MIPIHRHDDTSETVIVCRGKVREEFYEDTVILGSEIGCSSGGNGMEVI